MAILGWGQRKEGSDWLKTKQGVGRGLRGERRRRESYIKRLDYAASKQASRVIVFFV